MIKHLQNLKFSDKCPLALLMSALIAIAGCHESGTWVDDPRNYKRFFGDDKPKDVKVAHSYYSRTPHFTLEYEAFLQIKSNADFQKLILTLPLKKVTNTAVFGSFRGVQGGKLDWFAPKPLWNYDIWTSTNYGNASDYCILIDRESGDMFFTDRQ